MAGEPRTFVDTNVLLYAYDASETAKQPVARATLDSLWADRTGAISSQVLQEFYNAATRKLNPPVSRADAREIIDLYTAWPVVLLEPALILAATRIEEEHQLSFWDALVVEAARVAGAQRLLTEDMQHGRVIEGVRIENPFVATDQPHRQPASADTEGEQEVPGDLAGRGRPGRPIARVVALGDEHPSTMGSVRLVAEEDAAYYSTGEGWDVERPAE